MSLHPLVSETACDCSRVEPDFLPCRLISRTTLRLMIHQVSPLAYLYDGTGEQWFRFVELVMDPNMQRINKNWQKKIVQIQRTFLKSVNRSFCKAVHWILRIWSYSAYRALQHNDYVPARQDEDTRVTLSTKPLIALCVTPQYAASAQYTVVLSPR